MPSCSGLKVRLCLLITVQIFTPTHFRVHTTVNKATLAKVYKYLVFCFFARFPDTIFFKQQVYNEKEFHNFAIFLALVPDNVDRWTDRQERLRSTSHPTDVAAAE